jgi:hypothetical protein
MTEAVLTAPGTATRPRHKKRPHDLHLCTSADELVRALRMRVIDPLSLVYELVKPSVEIGVLFTGSIAWGIATEFSDLDIWVLLPGADAFKTRLPREINGYPVNHLPIDRPNRREVSFYPAGIEVDITFMINPAVDRYVQSGGVRESALKNDVHFSDNSFMTRLATGWTVHGSETVQRWRSYYETDRLRVTWMADNFTLAAKNLEDMEAGIGLMQGHVPAVGVYCVTRMLKALLAFNDCYSTSVKWMLRLGRLIEITDPEMRKVLIEGRELMFPRLLDGVAEERAYFERVHQYCGTVRRMLSREEGMADILDSVIHDLDIIL